VSLDPVTAIGDAVANVATALTPIINDSEAQKYANDYTQYITQYNEIMAANPVDLNAVNTYLMQLASRSGKAFGSLGNTNRECPVEYFDWLIERANFCNELVQVNASLQAKLTETSN
jgi:hypothetical protein